MSSPPRVVLITGANSGVGLAASKVLATTSDDHFHVIMTGRSLDKVLAAKKEIELADPDTASRLSAIHLDVTDSSSVQEAADQVSRTWGRLDALINNAAVGNIQSPDVGVRLQKCLETNVVGAAVVADRFRPLLLKSAGKPYSIFVSSGAGSVSVFFPFRCELLSWTLSLSWLLLMRWCPCLEPFSVVHLVSVVQCALGVELSLLHLSSGQCTKGNS